MASTTLDDFRSRFPILGRRIYVNSCSQGALSTDVDDALGAFTESWHTGGSPWDQWVGELERLRTAFAATIGADADEIAIMPNATTAAAAIATALPFDGARRQVVLSGAEFPTMAHLWQAQARRGAEIVWAGSHEDAQPPIEAFEPHMGDQTCIVPVAHVCFRNGYRLDIPRLVARTHEAGALVMLDDYQHTGTAPLDVGALGVDILVTGTLKYLLGPPGIALLYVRRSLIEQLEPLVTGWFGRADPFAFTLTPLDWAPTARRFETGSPAVPTIYGARAGLALLQRLGTERAGLQISHVVERMVSGAVDLGLDVLTPLDASRRGPLVVLRARDPQALVQRLAARGIIASARGTGLRVSFHAYNNAADVDAVLAALSAERPLLN
ncbi:MAG: aminotransferase class V-fold PLP-dependent enzyme [Acidobacteria bacterium]|nr:aminotransferase class V-fold PLP-dependent enzyme [Acidobacteriota bacterium]